MDPSAVDWAIIERLRRRFLAPAPGGPDYWLSRQDLSCYDATFARRIAWKWEYVLREVGVRGWRPPSGPVLDWGCGSGAAGRTFVKAIGTRAVSRLVLYDRSALAMHFAADRARAEFPGLAVTVAEGSSPAPPSTLLVSHVLTELTRRQVDELTALASCAQAVLWVEPGAYDASRALAAVRERLVGAMHAVTPCPHDGPCQVLSSAHKDQWCHHFAPSPPEAHRSAGWARFARIVGIDLRSLVLSYLVLDRRRPHPLPAGAVRVLGRPRMTKAHAIVMGCDESGLQEARLAKRTSPEMFRHLKRGGGPTLMVWQRRGDEIIDLRPWTPGAG